MDINKLVIIILLLYINSKTNFSEKKDIIEKNLDFKDNVNLTSIFIQKIKERYMKKGSVNLNEVEGEIIKNNWEQIKNKSNELNIGFQLDPQYILQAMITIASIMDSQDIDKRLRFHIAIVLNFTISDMIKIYSLKRKIRDDTEFNFYNASQVEKDLIGLNTKGPGAVAKLLLPHLIPDDITKLLIFDTGDLIVLKDLTEVYNWDMKNNMYVGVPDNRIGQKSLITKKIYKSYINVGSFLINVTKVKSENMYDKYVKYKNFYHSYMGDQDLLNDVAIGKIGMFPLKYGRYSPFKNETMPLIPKYYNKHLKQYLPENMIEYLITGYTPHIIHQWNSKWSQGFGLRIFRRIVQYYIRYAGIWKETCNKFPGYCQK